MNVYSAAEAIGPAWERTKSILLEPFEWRRYLKLTFVAMFAALSTAGFSLPNPARLALTLDKHHSLPAEITAALVGLAVIFGLGIFIVGLVLFYIGSRLQFVLFDVIATKNSTVGPIWRKYGSQTWRWIGLKLLLFLMAGVVGAMLAIVLMLPLIRQITHQPIGTAMSPADILRHILGPILLIIAFSIVVAVVYILLWDFAIPPMALENASIGTAIGRVGKLIRNEPGEILLYLLMRFLLGIVFGMAAMLVYALAMLISLLPFSIVGGVLYLALRNAGPAGHVLLIAWAIVSGLVLLVWNLCVYTGVIGYLIAFWQSYVLAFYGGRYPLLGNLLEPPPAPPVIEPEAPLPPPELPPELGLA
ncbi:MAG: DUF7544 domain-containing protein [Acidobacteriaceae bacterium]